MPLASHLTERDVLGRVSCASACMQDAPVCFSNTQGTEIRIGTSTPCTDRFSAVSAWNNYLSAVIEAGEYASDPDDECESPVCSPTAADKGQCAPGRYLIR